MALDMNSIKRTILALTLAISVFIGATVGRDNADEKESEPDEAEPPVALSDTLVARQAVVDAGTAESKRKQSLQADYDKEADRRAEDKRLEAERIEVERIAEERRIAEASRVAKVKAEAVRLAVLDAKREEARKVKADKEASTTPSRSQDYVGKGQSYELTYYTAQCNGCTGQSASGVWVNKSTHYQGYRVLAAPKSIPMYSILRITLTNGTSYDGIVLDRGGDIVNGRLDVLTASKDEAYGNGRHKAQVQVVRRGK